jgi:hypothetical protein
MPLTIRHARIGAFACVLSVAAASPARAQQGPPPAPRPPRLVTVPNDFPTIQAAIDSSRHGDTVLVAPGRYYENVRFKGRSIVLTSRFARTRDVADIERTIIDGSRPRHPDTATVVTIADGEDSTTVLQGFTITGGAGTVWFDAAGHELFREGGGVLCDLSSPTIQYNRIEGNSASAVGKGQRSAGGGGIRCGFAEPTIQNNVIRNNTGRYGAGIVLFHSASVVRNNVIAENVGGEDFGGAGVWIVGNLSRRLGSTLEHNTIVRNRIRPDTGTAPMRRGSGVLTTRVALLLRNNIVWANSKESEQLAFPPSSREVTLRANVVEGGPTRDGILTVDPQFADAVSFRLAPQSPAFAAGDQLGAYGGANGKVLPNVR